MSEREKEDIPAAAAAGEPGISASGKEAERRFMAITGAAPCAKAALGDAVLNDITVEIKHTKKTTTLNQVRAVKYIPLVVWVSGEDAWYVIPAHRIVLEMSRRVRGQHTENPFESSTLNLNGFGEFRLDSDADLAAAVSRSAAESAAYPRLRAAMEEVLAQAKSQAAADTERVRRILDELGLA